MNSYPKWWNTTLTIYNKFQDSQTQVIKWYRTVVEGCFWKDVGNKVIVGNTTLETNTIIARIREDSRFLELYEWVNKPNDIKKDYFTLGAGDIIIRGEAEDEINEYLSGHRSTDIISKYKDLQGCMLVEKYGNNTGGGRGNPHYYVKGI